MPTYWPSMPDDVQAWIKKQPVFFTASAPTHGKHINVSPKGYPSRSFAVMSPNQVAYIDGTGSGIETISHIYENGRCTIMFCSFTKFCRILRLFCTGRVIERTSPEFKPMILKMQEKGMKVEAPDLKTAKVVENGDDPNFEPEKEGNGVLGARAVVVLDVWKVQHSCGFGVPLLAGNPATGELEEAEEKAENGPTVNVGSNAQRSMDPNDPNSTKFDETWDDRNVLHQFAIGQLRQQKVQAYRLKNNLASLDEVPGLEMAMRYAGRNPVVVRLEHWFRRTLISEQTTLICGVLLGLFLALVYQRIAVRLGQ